MSDIIDSACTSAQSTLDDLPCFGISTEQAQTIMDDAFSGIEAACPGLNFCGASLGGKS